MFFFLHHIIIHQYLLVDGFSAGLLRQSFARAVYYLSLFLRKSATKSIEFEQ